MTTIDSGIYAIIDEDIRKHNGQALYWRPVAQRSADTYEIAIGLSGTPCYYVIRDSKIIDVQFD